jgi:hypothetical protein
MFSYISYHDTTKFYHRVIYRLWRPADRAGHNFNRVASWLVPANREPTRGLANPAHLRQAEACYCRVGVVRGAGAVFVAEFSPATGRLLADFVFPKLEIGGVVKMHRVTKLVPLLMPFVLTLAVGLCLAAVPGSKDSTTKATTKATTSSAAVTKSTAKSMKKSSARKMTDVLASAEDLSGTITAVDLSDKEVTLVGSNGVPYDFELTKKTRVELSDKKIGVNELSSESHKQATVHFLPTARGNLAETIQISAS